MTSPLVGLNSGMRPIADPACEMLSILPEVYMRAFKYLPICAVGCSKIGVGSTLGSVIYKDYSESNF
jgi:hypothetical protein